MIPPIRKILYATDLSKNSIYAFYYAVDMAKKYGAKISILNVIEPISARAYGSQTDMMNAEQLNVAMEVIKNRLQDFCSRMEKRNGLPCEELIAGILVQGGDPVEQILKTANQEGYDLIVLGDHGKGFLAQKLLGSVSRAVLDKARKPAFIIPLPSDETIAWDEI